MKTVSRMEREDVACDSYCAKHGLNDDILVSEEEGSREKGVEEEVFEELIEMMMKMKTMMKRGDSYYSYFLVILSSNNRTAHTIIDYLEYDLRMQTLCILLSPDPSNVCDHLCHLGL